MEGGAGKGLECQKTMDGKASNGNGSEKAIPSCCLKARASAPELEAKCHSTVVSGWFSECHSCPGHYLWFLSKIFIYFCCTWYPALFSYNRWAKQFYITDLIFLLCVIQGKLAKRFISTTQCGLVHNSFILVMHYLFSI